MIIFIAGLCLPKKLIKDKCVAKMNNILLCTGVFKANSGSSRLGRHLFCYAASSRKRTSKGKLFMVWSILCCLRSTSDHLSKKTLNDKIFIFLLDPDCWCRMGFCRFSPHEGNISMGWSKGNWIWLEIYAKKLWCKYRLGELNDITRFRT